MTRAEKLEGEIQLALVDAWEAIDRAVDLLSGPLFQTSLRRELATKVKALRGCVLLAAGRLIDVAHIEAGLGAEFLAKRKAQSNEGTFGTMPAREKKRYSLMCPLGFPDMSVGLGKLAKWIDAGEAELVPFFVPGSKTARAAVAERGVELERRQKVRECLAYQDGLLAAMSERARAADDLLKEQLRAAHERRVQVLAGEMRTRAGVS